MIRRITCWRKQPCARGAGSYQHAGLLFSRRAAPRHKREGGPPCRQAGLPAKQAGFSLFEILISVAILAIIASASSLAWTGYSRKQAVVAGTREFMNIIRETQGAAIGRIGTGEWGVHIVNTNIGNGNGLGPPYAVMYEGSDWLSGTPSRQTSLSLRVDLLSPSEPVGADDERAIDLQFEPRTGKLLNPDLLDLTCGGKCSRIVVFGLAGDLTREITIWEQGGIEVKDLP